MKLHLSIAALLLLTCCAFAQDAPPRIMVTGNAQKVLMPQNYKLLFFLQEEVTSENNGKSVTKTSLDSLKRLLFDNLKAYGIKEADLVAIKKSSTASGYSRTYINLYNITYQLKNQRSVTAQKLIDDLRFVGLKGIIARAQYVSITKTIQDSLYTAAVEDAHNNAVNLAKQINKTIGDAVTINGGYNSFRDFNAESDTQDLYNLTRFEMNLIDNKTYPVSINITYELKK